MPEIEIRPVKQDDLTSMIELDHSYKTDHMLPWYKFSKSPITSPVHHSIPSK
jgi:hypothetical protein